MVGLKDLGADISALCKTWLNTDYGRIERLCRGGCDCCCEQLNTDYGRIERISYLELFVW